MRCGPTARRCGSTTAIASATSPSCHVLDDRQYRSHHACRATLTRGKPLDELRRAARSRPHHAGRRAGGVVRRRHAPRLGALERDRPADADGRARSRAGRAPRLLGRRLGRLSGGAPAPARRGRGVAGEDTLVLGGDVHSFWAADLKQDFARPASPTVATEFVGGSITSQGPAADRVNGYLAKNPHIRAASSGVFGFGLVALEAKKADVSFRTAGRCARSEVDDRDPPALRRRGRPARRRCRPSPGSSGRRASRRRR